MVSSSPNVKWPYEINVRWYFSRCRFHLMINLERGVNALMAD